VELRGQLAAPGKSGFISNKMPKKEKRKEVLSDLHIGQIC